ncbi:MAG: winged helix-turn-helix transcriptional regulator [Methanosarcinaceae archaeon]|nr:winged helix-turn-helix transcriptional regulator [Methanosarcinaceae archaeon]
MDDSILGSEYPTYFREDVEQVVVCYWNLDHLCYHSFLIKQFISDTNELNSYHSILYIKHRREEDNSIIDFPILGFNISHTKKKILENIRSGITSVNEIGKSVDISKGMAYNHLRELKAMGYITDNDGYTITDAGMIAVI